MNSSSRLWTRLLVAAGMSAALAGSAVSASAAPIVYRGELTADNGLPYTGEVSVSAALYADMSGGTPLWESSAEAESVMGGILDYRIEDAAVDALLRMHSNLWLEFTIDGETLSPRQELTRVPYAEVAGNAMMLGGMAPSEFMAAGDTLDPNSLPTNAIGQVSNGALNNEFQNVAYQWTGSLSIPDSPTPGPYQEIATIETGNSYLTDLVIETGYSLSFGNEVRMVLFPPPSSGAVGIVLEEGPRTAGTHNMTWTPANTPALADLLGQKLAGPWILLIDDMDDNAAPGVTVGQLENFRVSYDVVRSDHMQLAGRLEVASDLDVGGDVRVQGMLTAPGVPMNFKAWDHTTAYNVSESWTDGPAWTYDKKLATSHLLMQGAFPYYITPGGSGMGIRLQYNLNDGAGWQHAGLANGPGHGWGAGGYGGDDAGIVALMEYMDQIQVAGTVDFRIQARKWSASDTLYFIGYGGTYPKQATWTMQEIPQ